MSPVNKLTADEERGLLLSVREEQRAHRFSDRRRYLLFGLSIGGAAGSIAGVLLGVNASLFALGCVFVAAWQAQELPRRKR